MLDGATAARQPKSGLNAGDFGIGPGMPEFPGRCAQGAGVSHCPMR
jgi:hypothetical protein